ncbi:MAG: 16S rRNA (adenine(1518)-N(6)/adenine(1519)-N(6))-dimethyltransferase RsmA [Ruminococcaceae bacterium]|nr:16S rRNA (adenine(1518)-N(6)/adenine(1519)-N(6))-dimethyltransferase RsmA [Oscillospiraceae bacterium]
MSESFVYNNKIKPNKKLGQNFLIDKTVAERMVDTEGLKEDTGVIEIGPGTGKLTEKLLKKYSKVVCIEIDKRFIPMLSDRFSKFSNFILINSDILKVDLHEIIEKHLAGKNVAVFGNLPYYITSPIIMNLLENEYPIDCIVAMMQKEAAERFAAEEGSRNSGAVTLAARYYSDVNILFEVGAESFYPKPKVDSSVVRFDILKTKRVAPSNEKKMFEIIKAAFSQRRKTSANAISSVIGIDKSRIEEILKTLGLDTKIRAERLRLADYCKISNLLDKKEEISN